MYDLIRALHYVEAELPELLDLDDWNTLHVTYEPPEVRRLWRQWGPYRIFLHEIHACEPETALFHPHPWPSIVKIIETWGSYQMDIGFGSGITPPPVAATTWLASGSVYRMIDPDGWHRVAPSAPVFSLMIAGPPWNREMPKADHPKQPPLAPEVARQLQERFGRWYPHRAREWSPELAAQLAELPVKGPVFYVATESTSGYGEDPEQERGDSLNKIDVPRIQDWLERGFRVEVRLGSPSARTRYLLEDMVHERSR